MYSSCSKNPDQLLPIAVPLLFGLKSLILDSSSDYQKMLPVCQASIKHIRKNIPVSISFFRQLASTGQLHVSFCTHIYMSHPASLVKIDRSHVVLPCWSLFHMSCASVPNCVQRGELFNLSLSQNQAAWRCMYVHVMHGSWMNTRPYRVPPFDTSGASIICCVHCSAWCVDHNEMSGTPEFQIDWRLVWFVRQFHMPSCT